MVRRYRTSHNSNNELSLLAALLLLSAFVVSARSMQHTLIRILAWGAIGVAALFIVGVITILVRKEQKLALLRALDLVTDIDLMSGVEFEGYVAALLQSRGYRTKLTRTSGDMGVDIIARKVSERIAVQVKRHTHPLDRSAVSDAVAGMKFYRCTSAMVVTNSYFRPGAIQLAQANGCVLVNRDRLAEWIIGFQR
jgi:restriction system protein